MAKPKTHSERTLFIAWIIELVKKHGRATTNEVAAMFGLHRSTAEKYLRIAVEQATWFVTVAAAFTATSGIIDFYLLGLGMVPKAVSGMNYSLLGSPAFQHFLDIQEAIFSYMLTLSSR